MLNYNKGPKSKDSGLIGEDFRFYVIEPNDSVSINSIIESRDVIFDENRFSLVLRPSLRILNRTEDIGGSVVPEEVTKEDDPKTFDEAMKYQDVAFWKEAINDEMDSIMGNNSWVLADLPPGFKPLGCKWIFKRKLKVDETIEKFKARLAFLKRCLDGSKFDETGKGVIICLYVDDMLIFGTDQVQVDLIKLFLSSRFSMKDIGEVDVILGIRIKHESNEIAISQSYYIENVLKKFNYFDCTPVSTPMDTSEKLMPNNGHAVSQLEYSRYTSNPSIQHWQAIQRVLKYLKKTMDYRLTYTAYPSVLEGYTDASWISNTDNNSSTSGWVFLLAAAGKEAEWLKNLLLEIPLWSKPIAPIFIRCDSAATLAKAYSQMYNGKSRHLGVRHNMIRELITNGVISIEFVRSQQNLADHLTKGLARDLVIKSAEGMGLNGLKHMYLHIIPRMCLESSEKEDEVANFLMVNFFEKMLSMSINKEEPPMYSNGLKGSILRTP
ncbi:zinc finger, CCHC-type containing protein [Tanacetum coccineum]|uniref:Zinc finger, CCHC-type containing protein n=1 Tax=Tanacetum coccineum TaxID=301880 RepID=A0ABQ4X787_9ASTR